MSQQQQQQQQDARRRVPADAKFSDHVSFLHRFICSTDKDVGSFFKLCVSFSRGIDYAVTNNDVPSRAQELPLLLKQVFQCKGDILFQTAIMLLMTSVKNACKAGWFSEKDNQELSNLSDKLVSSFCSLRDVNTEESSFLPTISAIFSRFYPQLRMGKTLVFFEAKPGYGAFVKDFQISRNTKSSPEEKICLLVAQTDDIETSSCIISPPKVSFLLNGKGLEKRTNVYMDLGPQIPSTLEHLLKYGTNLLQAVGQFNGNYIIAVALMSVISNPGRPALPDFIPPAIAALDSDGDIMEGPSRISLNCPISFTRIKTPVKGHSCKHLQCFDFDNFVEINSRRPSWRCPHCNQSVSFPDIRIDQNMVKILKDVGEDVSDVIISANGSWKAATDTGDHTDKTVMPAQEDSSNFLKVHADIMDLTIEDNGLDLHEEEIKPSPCTSHIHSNVANQTSSHNHSDVANQTCEMNQSIPSDLDDFWTGLFLSPNGIVISNSMSESQYIGCVPEFSSLSTPAMHDAVSTGRGQEFGSLQRSDLFSSLDAENHVTALNNMHLQQYGSLNTTNEHVRGPPMDRQSSSVPIPAQALPARVSSGVSGNVERLQQSSRSHLNPPQESSGVSSNMERLQQSSRSHLNLPHESHMASLSVSRHSGSQNLNHRAHLSSSRAPSHQPGAFAVSNQQPTAVRASSARPSFGLTLHQQQTLNQRNPHLMQNQNQVGQSGPGVTAPRIGEQARYMAAASRALQMGRQSSATFAPVQLPSSSEPVNTAAVRVSIAEQGGIVGVPVQPVSRSDSTPDVSTQQNWRPTGRMRGSLSGQAYADALNHYLSQPNQPAQATRPIMPGPAIPPQLQSLITNSQIQNASQAGHPMLDTNMTEGSRVLPPESSGMQ